MKKVIITTGGTGGHIYPALSVAKELLKKDIDVLFVGSNIRMEKDMVPKENIRFIGLDIIPFKSFKSIVKLFKAIKETLKIINEEDPEAIIGFGNYISLPMIISAIIKRKKLYLQEQNANLGLVNKLFYRFAVKTFLAFEKTYDDIPIKYQNKFKVTGNPLREDIYYISCAKEKEEFNVTKEEKVLLITGGSLGAQSINNAIVDQWEELSNLENLKIFWATGEKHYDGVIKKIGHISDNITIKPYFDNMLSIMAASDLLICRAGALTISEIIELNKPSILIPFNSVKVGQYENAMILKDIEGALIFDNPDAKEAVVEAINLLEDSRQLLIMKSKLKSLKKQKAWELILESLDIFRGN